ncbi:MAG: C39 family peptidase [Candidatus Heimdallarchaeaceae archaeon]
MVSCNNKRCNSFGHHYDLRDETEMKRLRMLSTSIMQTLLLIILLISSFNLCLVKGESTIYVSEVLSAWAYVIPIIDGFISPGEWDDAATKSFILNLTNDETHKTILYIKNDDMYLYLALKIFNDDYNVRDSLHIFFDNDNDGIEEDGDDSFYRIIGFIPGGAMDEYYDADFKRDRSDTEDGGTNDVVADSSHTNPDGIGDYTFEFKHPLDSSDDLHDFSLSPGDIVGFQLEFDDAFEEGLHAGPYPDFTNYDKIRIASREEHTQILDISLIAQETNYSCWAASSLMLLNYYGLYSSKSPTQLELAQKMGNERYYWDGLRLYEILPIIGRWESTLETLGKLDFDRDVSLTFNEVIEDIDHERPIMAFYAGELWIGKMQIPIKLIPYHVVVIAGYIDRLSATDDEVIVFDPWPPNEGTTYSIKWVKLKNELYTIINAVRTRPQVLEGVILTLQESQHKLFIHVYDSKGRHTGFNHEKNQIDEEIPGSRYYDLNRTITIILPTNVTSFHYVVDAKYVSISKENYTIVVTNLRNGTLTSELRKDGVIKQNEKQEFSVRISPDARKVEIEVY